MPNHVYHPQRNPPLWYDRLMIHPMEVMAALLALLFSVLLILSLFFPEFAPSKSMDKMPLLVVILNSAFLGAGSILAVVGLNWGGDEVSMGWALEKFGWLLSAGGFLTYSISVSWHYPASLFSWSFPLVLGLGSLLRCFTISMIEKLTRQSVAEYKGKTHE